MSYRKRKLKKSTFGQWKFRILLAWNTFFGNLWGFFRKKGGPGMRFPQTRIVMTFLREKTRFVRPNNLRINEWVDEYLDRCAATGEPVTILSQWCISKSLEPRYEKQGRCFVPMRQERRVFGEDIPKIAEVFQKNGFTLNWWMTFNRSFLDSGRVVAELEQAYKETIIPLTQPLVNQGWFVVADWEDDVLRGRPKPNPEVLQAVERFVAPKALELEVQRHSTWTREQAGLNQSVEELRQDVYFQIACEAEEGRLLGEESSFGELILMPFEVGERYDFFTLSVPDFKKRIVAVLPAHPWRP